MGDSGKTEAGAKAAIGASAQFPYDRMSVQHFREEFPRARWSDERKAWFIPGKTAARRFERWLERENAAISVHADARGRDAYRFEPLHSRYLTLHDDGFEIATPYSRTVVALLREVPFAAWDAGRKVWTVPFRSFEKLRKRWPQIEEAAARNEPEQRRAREAERRASLHPSARLRSAERRRRRHPLDPDHLPPLDRPVMTRYAGIVVFVRCDGELISPELLRSAYAELPQDLDFAWGHWRPASLDELIRTWPAKTTPEDDGDLWRQPTLEELREARKAARGRERRNAQL